MAINPGRYHVNKEPARSAMKGGLMAEEYLAKSSNDWRRNAYAQGRTDRRKTPRGELLRRKLSLAEIIRNEMTNDSAHVVINKELVRSAMKGGLMAEEYLAKSSNNWRRNAYAQIRTDRRKELLRRKLNLAEIVRDEMTNDSAHMAINKELAHDTMKGNVTLDESTNYPDDRSRGFQAILERRKSQAGKFWRKTQAGELLRRELSMVEISCIIFMLSAALASYY